MQVKIKLQLRSKNLSTNSSKNIEVLRLKINLLQPEVKTLQVSLYNSMFLPLLAPMEEKVDVRGMFGGTETVQVTALGGVRLQMNS